MCKFSNHILRINYIYVTPKLSEYLLIYWFGTNIDKLFVGSDMRNNNIPLYSMIYQEMVSYVYVFGSRILTSIVSNIYGTLIVT
jgi:hypothetical protein